MLKEFLFEDCKMEEDIVENETRKEGRSQRISNARPLFYCKKQGRQKDTVLGAWFKEHMPRKH